MAARKTHRKILTKVIPVKMNEQLHKETVECAEAVEESLNEYIRNAIKSRNDIKKGGE